MCQQWEEKKNEKTERNICIRDSHALQQHFPFVCRSILCNSVYCYNTPLVASKDVARALAVKSRATSAGCCSATEYTRAAAAILLDSTSALENLSSLTYIATPRRGKFHLRSSLDNSSKRVYAPVYLSFFSRSDYIYTRIATLFFSSPYAYIHTWYVCVYYTHIQRPIAQFRSACYKSNFLDSVFSLGLAPLPRRSSALHGSLA